jgi:hypothetical protein
VNSFPSKWTLWGAAALSILTAACGEPLDPSSRVVDLRVLAVQADEPYAHPGDTVRLSALGVDPRGRELTWGWTTCENPEDSTVMSCLDALTAAAANGDDVELTTGVDMNEFQVTVDERVITSLPDGFRDRAMIAVVSVLCPGTLEPRLASETSNEQPLPIVCRDPDSGKRIGPFDFVTGVKRLFVRTEDRNRNPDIADVTLDGKVWTDDEVPSVTACDVATDVIGDCPESTHHLIAARPTSDVAESGMSENGEQFEEQVVIQYYATGGTFEDEVRIHTAPDTKWAAGPAARDRELTFWFVIRDNRGGVSWVSRRLRVEG